MYWAKYHQPRSLDEAISLLTYYGGEGRVVAGGTDLMLQLREGKVRAGALVDLGGLSDLKQIREEGGFLKVGSLCSHAQVASSPLVREKAPALAAAAASVGSPQIRNVGTLGGNVVNAQPAADTSIALLALGAVAALCSRKGTASRPLEELFAGVGRSAVDPTAEILCEFSIPLSPGRASSFLRLSRRRALSLPILNAAVALELSGDRKAFQGVRIAVGPVATVPWRAREAEDFLSGGPVSEGAVREACRLASEKAGPRDSLRGGSQYRREMIKVLVYRAIKESVEKLGGVING